MIDLRAAYKLQMRTGPLYIFGRLAVPFCLNLLTQEKPDIVVPWDLYIENPGLCGFEAVPLITFEPCALIFIIRDYIVLPTFHFI